MIQQAVVLTAGNEICPEDLVLGLATGKSAPVEMLLNFPFHNSLEAHNAALVRHALVKAQGP